MNVAKRDKLFTQISELPHNFSKSNFMYEHTTQRCEDYINIFCNCLEIVDHFIHEDIPAIITFRNAQ